MKISLLILCAMGQYEPGTSEPWDKYGEYVASDLPISVSLNNQFHYYFKIVAYDLAGNHLINESYQDIIVDPENDFEIWGVVRWAVHKLWP